jgi:hypothetical protein
MYTNIFHCKTLQNWKFWFENIPSGNPGLEVLITNLRRATVECVSSIRATLTESMLQTCLAQISRVNLRNKEFVERSLKPKPNIFS